MRDTTGSVPDAASRRVDGAAPSNSSEISDKVTSVSSGRVLATQSWPQPQRSDFSTLPPAIDLNHALEQLMLSAGALAASRIHAPALCHVAPFCRECLMSGLNGHPIEHLESCNVGQVLAAIEVLR